MVFLEKKLRATGGSSFCALMEQGTSSKGQQEIVTVYHDLRLKDPLTDRPTVLKIYSMLERTDKTQCMYLSQGFTGHLAC